MRLKHLHLTQRQAQAGVLHAPASFLLVTEERLLEVCNGCGAADSWFRPPKTIYGTLIVQACIIHDWMYNEGNCIEDKQEADRVFLNNMMRLIALDSVKWYKPTRLQRIRACEYYRAVDLCGGTAFWVGKNT